MWLLTRSYRAPDRHYRPNLLSDPEENRNLARTLVSDQSARNLCWREVADAAKKPRLRTVHASKNYKRRD